MRKKLKSYLLITMFLLSSLFIFTAWAQAAESSIALAPGSGTYNAGDKFNVEIVIPEQVDSLSGIELHLDYDPGVLQINEAESGKGSSLGSADWLELLKTVDNSSGRIDLSYGTLKSTALVSGSNLKVGVLSFTAKAAGTGNVAFVFDAAANRNTFYQVKSGGVSSDKAFSSHSDAIYTVGSSPVQGSVVGKVLLEARSDHAGVSVNLMDLSGEVVAETTTDSAGSYQIEVMQPGHYYLALHRAHYLRGKVGSINVETGKPSNIAQQVLTAGDIVESNKIDLFDLASLVMSYSSATTDKTVDLNDDGKVDSSDLYIIGKNYSMCGQTVTP
ncbi:MAG: carboxypeptidase regulatory-like domain-containing protein [Desulfotomaculaceae bacterium]|nr:carboxypeptidase regulatory-like domain-containing protein [Desulfotomaculaceae bacterium]